MPAVRLKPGREKSLLRRHPWVYSGAIAHIDSPIEPGSTVEITSDSGEFLAWGAYSPKSQISIRVWSWNRADVVDELFLRKRIQKSCSLRGDLGLTAHTNAIRLIHAESDGIPGLIADLYGSTLVLQFLSAGAEYWRSSLTALLQEISSARCVFERSDAEVRELEGLPIRTGLVTGELPASPVIIHENALQFKVDVEKGHKTGFYLDQRSNRLQVREFSNQRDVLDCFCYSGGFTMNALLGGANSVTAMDSSAEALASLRENLTINQFPPDRVQLIEYDVFQGLRMLRDRAQSFDLIILDPPKFAPTGSQVERAARGYKDINLLAFKLLRPGGFLFTFSCSAGVTADLFRKIVTGAALDANIHAQVVQQLHQAPDHPVALNFPEGEYLKGLIVQRGF